MDKPIEHSHEAARGSGVDRPAPHALEGYRTHKSAGQEDYLAEAWGLPSADEPDDRSAARDEKAAAASKEGAGKTGGEGAGKTGGEGAVTGKAE